jgi:ribose 5-phosphate isomerase B
VGIDVVEIDVREIARRAAGRVLAERGLTPTGGATSASRPALGGVHVDVEREPGPARATPARGREVVSASSLAQVRAGESFRVPPGALVTPLAEEEARRRGIRLESGLASEVNRALCVAVASDHGGFALKREVLGWLGELGATGVDLGTRDENPVDYPDFARAVAEAVASGQCRFGICIDGAGIGSAMAANKVPGVRAANCCDVAMARNAREHNFANVLTLGAKLLARGVAYDIVRAFLGTPDGAQRHRNRVQKITEIEQVYSGRSSRAPEGPRA